MRGWVCVGAMAGFEVQVWWEGGHIQISSTCMGPPIPHHCCGAVGTAVLAHLWHIMPFPCQHFLPVCILFPDTQHKWTRTCKK